MHAYVIKAIFKRNFVSYFSNPTGYVFICVFVFLSSVAAFWPNEFFNANLANLDQLNKAFPFIMLVFIPAITMSIWAEERRQGTDELLLTIPAGDFDVVIGKYLAAVAIFSVSLLFSLVCNLAVLWSLGSPDLGLFMGTYFGYWMVGLAMLAIGMVASFLTGNLPISFILGALFNAPLALAAAADAVPLPAWLVEKNPNLVLWVKSFSFGEQLRDFSRGVISFAGMAYFLAIVALMLYLSMVLIGRRHWRGGVEGRRLAAHYGVRFAALAVVVIGLNMFLARHDRARVDITSEQLSSLSPKTRQLLQDMDAKYLIHVQAFISKTVPEGYVPTKLNLISALREFEALGGDKIKVDIKSEMEPFTDDAVRAEQQFGIKPQVVESRTRGARVQEPIFLGAAITCGLEKKVVPFFDRGLPVEYELIRSIAVVSQQKQKKVGVLATDAKLYGGFDMQSMSSTRNQLIIDELQKQYEVVPVDPNKPIADKYDVLLAVQPSSLTPPQMDNFIDAVRSGQPTAIFEDPLPHPFIAGDVPGTSAPKMPPGGGNMFMQRQPPQPKGDIRKLWELLQVRFRGDSVVWQDYNPQPKALGWMTPEWVFVDKGEGNAKAFNESNAISSSLQQLLFPFPGSVTDNRAEKSLLSFTPLLMTGEATGTVACAQLMQPNFLGGPRLNPTRAARKSTGDKYVIAAHIHGKLKSSNLSMSDKAPEDDGEEDHEGHSHDAAGEASPVTITNPHATAADEAIDKILGGAAGSRDKSSKAKDSEINVVLVADIDCLYSVFFALRARGDDPEEEMEWKLDNVPFVLNVLDVLSGDDRFVEIRKRRHAHRTLTKVATATQQWRDDLNKSAEKAAEELENAIKAEQKKLDERVAKIEKDTSMSRREKEMKKQVAQVDGQRHLDAVKEQLEQKQKNDQTEAERDLTHKIRRVQDGYKLMAVLVPPIPPLIVAFLVFFNRRAREREGVAKSRLR